MKTRQPKQSKLYSGLFACLCATLVTVGCSQTTADNASKKATQATTTTANDTSNKDSEKSTETTPKSNNSEVKSTSAKDFNEAELIKILSANLAVSGIEADIKSIEAIEVEGLYWVRVEGIPAFFTDKSGKYVIQGDVIKVGADKPVDITANLNAQVNKEILAKVKKEEMIIYPAKGETKDIIYVFTDATCPYCHKLHEEVAELNAKGIEVRYLAWPRNKRAEPIMQAVWCAKDQKDAMDKIQAGTPIEPNNCDSKVVESQTELGFALGVQGTPAIFTESGEKIGGYLPAKAIEKALGL